MLRPKTKFWRFGIRLSKTEKIEFYHPKDRYKSPEFWDNYIDIHLGVGEWDNVNWSLPNRFHLVVYNLTVKGDKELNNQDTYVENGDVKWEIIMTNDKKNLATSYNAEGCKPFTKILELPNDYKYFKVFAWADKTNFEIDCGILINSNDEYKYNSEGNLEPSSFSNSYISTEVEKKLARKTAECSNLNLNNLIQKYSRWYSVSEGQHEFQFGKAIGELLEISEQIVKSEVTSDLVFTLNVTLTKARNILNLLKDTYESIEDIKILEEFKGLIGWAEDMIQNIMKGHADLWQEYSGSSTEKGNLRQKKGDGKIDFKTLKGRLLSDQSTDNDLLGFSVYSTAIAELIRTNVEESDNEEQKGIDPKLIETKAGRPFNIGIIAPWGHGKTTLMRNVQQTLDPEYKDNDEKAEIKLKTLDRNISSKTTTYQQLDKYLKGRQLNTGGTSLPKFPSVWFNAWRYQSSDQIWAGIGHAIITQLSSRLSAIEQEKFWFKLQLSRVDKQKVRKEFYSDLIRKSLPLLICSCIAFVIGIGLFFTKIVWEIPTLVTLSGVVSSIVGYFKSLKQNVDGRTSIYFDEPDYSAKLGVYHNIIHDLHKVFSLVLNENQRAVIFIDDLDRCSPNVIGDVFEAVNLMMVDPIIGKHCYFIFGMDAQVVAAALDNKYSLMSGKLKEQEDVFGTVGWYFLDKFIQLPFNVPIMSQEERLAMLKYYFEPEKKKSQPLLQIVQKRTLQ